MEYIKGWFFIDLVSIIPIGSIFNSIEEFDIGSTGLASLNSLARLSKITKMYRLIKLTK